MVVLKGPRICWGRRVFYLSHLRFAAAVRGSLGISRGLCCWLLDQCSLESSGWLPLRTSLLRCVPVLNAGIAFLDGSGVGTKYFCQPQERCDVVFGPFSLQDLELLDFSYSYGEDQGNLGAIKALGDMLPPLNRT